MKKKQNGKMPQKYIKWLKENPDVPTEQAAKRLGYSTGTIKKYRREFGQKTIKKPSRRERILQLHKEGKSRTYIEAATKCRKEFVYEVLRNASDGANRRETPEQVLARAKKMNKKVIRLPQGASATWRKTQNIT